MEVNRIYCESAMDTLSRMPDNFLDMVMTSPPFFGLRSYGTEPQVWGGDDCDHVWGKQIKYAKEDKRTPEQKAAQGAVVGNSVNSIGFAVGNSGAFCQSCGSWRGELGLEPTFQLYISHLIDIFREVKRVLKPTGTVWVNLGDSFSGSWGAMSHSLDGKGQKTGYVERPNTSRPQGIRSKSLMNIPARFAIAMTDELQFINRNHIIWHKPACMPSSAKDRFTVDFESIFFFTKSDKYWFEQQLEDVKQVSLDRVKSRWKSDHDSIGHIDVEQMGSRFCNPEGRNMRTVWKVNFEPQSEEHYASYPTKLISTPILAGCPEGGIVYDPFTGTGTTQAVAYKLGRQFLGSELNPKYYEIANKRLEPLLAQGGLFENR